MVFEDIDGIICDEVERTLAGLPTEFAQRLGPVTILEEDMHRLGLE